MIEAGRLNRRVTLLRETTAENEFGEYVETWAPVGVVWASFTPVSDAERVRSAEVAAMITARFVLRWSALSASLTPNDRLRFDGRDFNVVATKELGYREAVEVSGQARAE